jgi:hypothetical protein
MLCAIELLIELLVVFRNETSIGVRYLISKVAL